MNAQLTHGGLFEGYGGTTMAAAAVLGDLDTRWVSDIKPASVALLAHRHPSVPNLGDLTAIDFTAVDPVDVLTFSWPCQPFSSAGRRLGEGDPRALWPHVERAIAGLRPRILLGENVARIVGSGELRRAVRSLAELGYVGAWRCLTASTIGAPHKRDRCFLVAVRADAAADTLGVELRDERGRGGGAHRQGAGVAGHDGPQGTSRLTLLPTPTQNMTTGAGTSGRDGGMNLQTAAVRLLPTPNATDGTKGGGRDLALSRRDPKSHGPRLGDLAGCDWREYEPAIRRWEAILGRPAPAPTQPSLRAPHGPQLAPAFVEWMMGLPQGWVTDAPTIAKPGSLRNAALSLLGDGVVPQQGAAAYRELLGHLLGAEVAA